MFKFNIETKLYDLYNIEDLNKIKKYDNILMINFMPSKLILSYIPKILNEGGIFMWVTFNKNMHLFNNKFRLDYCLNK
jgi:hypothetical protein